LQFALRKCNNSDLGEQPNLFSGSIVESGWILEGFVLTKLPKARKNQETNQKTEEMRLFRTKAGLKEAFS